jgi:hypothetical protein
VNKLRLGPIEDDTPIKVAHDLPASLHRDLVEYARLLAAETGTKPVEPVKLIVPMLTQFIAGDRGFSRGRKTRSAR